MRLSHLMAIMYVMGRLGVWSLYLRFIEEVLKLLDGACEEEYGPLLFELLDVLPDMEATIYD